MSWSLRQSRRAAGAVRAAECGRLAHATVRPSAGLVRQRAPLTLLLYVASREGLIVSDGAGFALLRPPSGLPRTSTRGPWLRLLSWLDRHWGLFIFAAPCELALTGAGFAAWLGSFWLAIGLVFAAISWLLLNQFGQLADALRWIRALANPPTRTDAADAESLPAYYWSIPLLHQQDPRLVAQLLRLARARVAAQVRAEVQLAARVAGARTSKVEVLATIVCLTRGVTSEAAKRAVSTAVNRVPGDVGDVVLLLSDGRLERAPAQPRVGGGFLLLYLAALGLAIAACALFVASAEAGACREATCADRPATYASALRFLAQRVFFSDPPSITPATTEAVAFGWLISLAGLVGVFVTYVAGRNQIELVRDQQRAHRAALADLVAQARVLLLVVTQAERDAAIESITATNGAKVTATLHNGRTVLNLGLVAGAQVLLAQAAEPGTSATAGMAFTADAVIEGCRPDCVILVGICYGLRPTESGGDQQVGDVIVATRIANADHRRVSDRPDRPAIVERGVNVPTSPRLLDRCRDAERDWPGPTIHFGPTVCSNTLVDSAAFVARLRERFPDAIAGEMEATGVYETATARGLDWIMVKAIADFGHDKTDAHQASAARNAANFVTHLILNQGIERWPDRALPAISDL